MTEEEAVKVIKILAQADGGCPVCVGAEFDYFERAFPEFKTLLDGARVYQDDYRMDEWRA